jgi:uncharacterized protein YcaQ
VPLAFSREQARTMLLAAQGLIHQPEGPIGPDQVLDCIRRMGVLQIDTISVVARSPYLVLWSRLGAYKPTILEDLLATTKLFEYWSHEACFIPIEDFPLYRRLMLGRLGHRWGFKWLDENPEAVAAMLEHARKVGELRSSDFERADGKKSGWWEWKSEKMALDMLYTMGHLMIARRERFQRVYAPLENVLPDWKDDKVPDYETVLARLVEKSVRCLGVAPARFVADYFRLPKTKVKGVLDELCGAGELIEATVEDIPGPAYIHPSQEQMANQILNQELTANRTVLLSPFDPVVWDRKRNRELFDFDYTIECYTPAPKRRYGYFVLPILHQNRLVGRLDAKAHRKEKIFEVKAIYFEDGIKPDEEMLTGIGQTIRACAKWHGTPKTKVVKSDPKGLVRTIQGIANRRA